MTAHAPDSKPTRQQGSCALLMGGWGAGALPTVNPGGVQNTNVQNTNVQNTNESKYQQTLSKYQRTLSKYQQALSKYQ